MEHSIGVGIIVGLTFASSAYIWNSDSFTKEQKTILLIFLVFPPLQWIATLLVSIYNTNRENNSFEKITEKKLDSTIANLTDLKQKGIITENEYKEKTAIIEQEKEEQNLKDSIEYKQLNSLFESKVLTKEEFDIKIELLRNLKPALTLQNEQICISKIENIRTLIDGKIISYTLTYNNEVMYFYEIEKNGKVFISINNNKKYFLNRKEFIEFVKK